MDTTDARILRHFARPDTFQWNVRPSYVEIGREVGLDAETVRARLLRLADDGVITGWDVTPNPSLLGRAVSRIDLPRAREVSERDRIVAALGAMDGVRWIFEDLDGGVAAVLFHPVGALDAALALLRAIAGGVEAVAPLALPSATMELRPSDWRIVRTLRRGPRRPYADIAREAGCSERTLRRRLDALTDGRALALKARTDMGRVRGGVPATLRIVHPDSAAAGHVAALVRELPGLFRSQLGQDETRVSFLAEGVGEAEDLRRMLKGMPGVVQVDLRLVVRSHTVDGWLDAEIERRAAAADAAPRERKRR